MSIAHVLEDFSALSTGSPVFLTEVSLEERRLAAFEAGYQAGWDDSVEAQKNDKTRVSTDLAQNLHDLSFTYQEAYVALLEAMQPLLRQMVETVLPHAAHETLGVRIVQMLQEIASEQGRHPVEIVTASENVDAIRNMITVNPSLTVPVTVSGEQSLGSGQVFLRVGSVERSIDLSEVLAEIDRAVAGFFAQIQKDVA